MKSIRTTALLILLSLLSSLLASCSKTDGDNNDTTIPAAIDTQPTVETKADPLAGINFNGESIRIYTSTNDPGGSVGNSNAFIQGPSEETGDIVDDSVYKRNMDVEDLLNVNLEYTGVDLKYTDVPNAISKLILSGDDSYDLIIQDLFPIASLSLQGMFMNVKDAKYLDFDQNYWWKSYMEDLTIGNQKMFILAGDFFIDVLRSAHALYFNKDLMTDIYGDPNQVYQLVNDGKWTIDKFLEYVKGAYRDLNGNTIHDADDQYGLVTFQIWGASIPFIMSGDINFINRDAEGIPSIAVNNDRSYKLLEKLNQVFYSEGTKSNYEKEDASNNEINRFINGNALFIGYQRIGSIQTFRSMEDEIGIIPYPKLDETQENYSTSSHDTTEIGVIPSTCTKFDTVCAVVEALCRETQKTVIPAYYETALKIKYTRDDLSAQMIDIIHDNIRQSFALAYSYYCDHVFTKNTFYEPLAINSTDLSSAYAKIETSAKAKLNDIIKTFIENN